MAWESHRQEFRKILLTGLGALSMKTFFKQKSIFLKFILSYIVLIIFITMMLGFTAYFYSSSNYNKEIKKLDNELIDQYKKIIEDNIIVKAEKLYLDLITARTRSFDLDTVFQSDVGDIAVIAALNNYLNYIVISNTDILDAVHIYFTDSKILVSSKIGLKYLNEVSGETPANMDWIAEFDSLNAKSHWRETKASYVSDGQSINIFTFVKTYPYSMPSSTSKGYIAFDIKEEALYGIIDNANLRHSGDIFIIDNKGNSITHSNAENVAKNLTDKKYILDIIKSPLKSSDFIDNVDGIASMISYTTFSNDWSLVKVTPVNDFYRASNTLQKALLILCLTAIFIGVSLALIFSKHLYNPIKHMVSLVQSLFKTPAAASGKSQNEYIIINNAINNLSSQVDLLQNHLQANRPLIKHIIVTNLLQGKFKSLEALEQHLNLINTSFNGTNFMVMIFKADDLILEKLDIQNIQYYKYDLISKIESRSADDIQYISTELADGEIAAIVCSKKNQLPNLYEQILSYTLEFYMIQLNVSIGTWVTNVMDLAASYNNAKITLQYKFLFPSSTVFISNKLMERELSNSIFSDDFFRRFSKAIRSVNMEYSVKCFQEFTRELVTGTYSYQYCNTKMLEMVSILSIYVKELNYNTKDIWDGNIFSMFQNISSICEYEKWFIDLLTKTLEYIEAKNNIKIDNIINTAIDFIRQNLGKDMSLEGVAGKVYLSPSYFSRSFKEFTNMNFTDYLIQQRLEKAKYLLESTTLKVEDIAKVVGFNTPHYFTKKFKEAFGITPVNFKHKI